MADEKRERPVPPYVPWKTFETYLDGLKAFGPTLPNVIDRDSMRNFSGATQSWLLSGLRSLNMIDDEGVPKARLKQIAHATTDERKPMLRQLIEAEYQFLKGISLQGATPKQIESAFETTGATGDTVRKCIGFFVGMAKAADLPLSPMIMKVRRRPTKNGGGTRKKPEATPITITTTPKPSETRADALPEGFERTNIPGLPGAYIQYPVALTEANCDVMDAMMQFLRAYAKAQAMVLKEKKP